MIVCEDRPRNGLYSVSGGALNSTQSSPILLSLIITVLMTDVVGLAYQPVITTSELLRQRSNLRPVTQRGDNDEDVDVALPMSLQSSTTDEHVRLLREALERIKKSSGTDDSDNDDDDDGSDDDDFVD